MKNQPRVNHYKNNSYDSKGMHKMKNTMCNLICKIYTVNMNTRWLQDGISYPCQVYSTL